LEKLVLKRRLDITLAGFLLAVSLPILAIAALIIELESGEPAIFRQDRMGRGLKRFKLYKLRTMRSSCAGSAYTLGADPRITGIGLWLRRFKIDELPQLWNVLCGDMSLVGPRPVIPELIDEFQSSYARLLAVRPGLTDPATLKYCREVETLAQVPDPLDYFKTVIVPDKLRISNTYLEHATVRSDIMVLMRTAVALLPSSRRGQSRQAGTERGMVAGRAKLITAVGGNRSR
jgi:lipopolysaccharide/colanic/teichoic acid biosynthesis glycosyltransferase